MSTRAMGVTVSGGRRTVLSSADFAFIRRTLHVVGAKMIYTDGTEGVAAQVEAWAQSTGIPVSRITANWMHDGPATPAERNTSLVELARTVIAFPGEEATQDLIAKAHRRRLRVFQRPSLSAEPRTTSISPAVAAPRPRISS